MHGFAYKTKALIIMLLLNSIASSADSFRFKIFEMGDGLPSNTVRSLMQDSRGFLWIGTGNGLSRFDGHSFKNFMPERNDSSTLANGQIYVLLEDYQNTIWVGTDAGIYTYNSRLEHFSFFSTTTSDSISIKNMVTSIREDKDKNLWFSTLGQGIFFFDREKNVLKNYVHDPNNLNSLNSDMIQYLYINNHNVVWASSQRGNGIINRYDPASDQFLPLQLKISGDMNDFRVSVMYEDKNHNFWIGTRIHGLFKLDPNTGNFQSFFVPGTPSGISHIHEITEYEDGMLFIGSDDGLSIFNTMTYDSELMTVSEFKSSTLSDKFIYPILKDKEGGIWVGTYYGGVNYAPPLKANIAGYSHSQLKNSVGGNIVSCFAEDKSGNIWIGSDDGGLSYFDTKKKMFTNYMPDRERNSLSYHNIHALCLDNEQLWIGTYSGGLNVLDLKTKRFKHYFASPEDRFSLYGNSIYSIYKDNDEQIWIGTMEGICMYDREKDNFIRMKETGITTIDIASDKMGNIWFATWGKGLYLYNKHSQKWKHYLYNPNNKTSIPNDQINSLFVDKDDTVWLGTKNGLAVYNREDDTFSTIFSENKNNNISYVCKINEELWITTGNGVISYSLSTGIVRHFNKSDGLQSNQFNMKAGLVSASGELYVGSTNGFNIMLPEDIYDNENIPPIYITNIQVFNKSLKIDKQGPLTEAIIYTKEIELSYKENVFSIEYVALSYNAPYKNQYKYRLEGFDKGWNDVGFQQRATYTNIPAGKYTFHVIGSNNDGIWNTEGARLTITINPPFWKTSLAYVFYTLLSLILIALIIYQISKKTEKRHKEHVKQLQIEKEKELHEAKINFFTLVAHEIRTPVSLIIGPLEKIMDNVHNLPDSMQNALNIVSRNSQNLLSLINQLLDFRKAENNAFIINHSYQKIYDLLYNLYVRLKPLADHNNLVLSFEMDDKDLQAVVDPEALAKIVGNLMTNAIKYAKSNILLTCVSESEHFIIKVMDDGDGIPPNEQDNIFLPFYQVAQGQKPGTGIGLSLVKLLVDAMHGKIEVVSKLGEQTVFTVILPKNQKINIENQKNKFILEDNISPGEASFMKESSLPQLSDENDNKPSLLITDDSSEMRRFLYDNLHEYYKITEAKNGKDALERLKKHPFDIIICDIMMPFMDGIELTRKIKENIEWSHIPVILLTAKTDRAVKIEGMEIGADAYIEKPFSMKLLQAQIDNLIKSRIALRKKFSEMPFMPLNSVAGSIADKTFLDKMNKIIDKNIASPDFSVDMMAEKMLISRSGLFEKIKSLTGMTPNDLIQLVRLKKAAELLAANEEELRINEICYKVGFNSPSYFAKCFQKQFGKLPRDFVNNKKSS